MRSRLARCNDTRRGVGFGKHWNDSGVRVQEAGLILRSTFSGVPLVFLFCLVRRRLLQCATIAALVLLPAARAAAQYASPALQALVSTAAERNRLPDSLQAYSANVETEISLVIRRADGTEAVGSVEQIASTLRWTRTGKYDQRVQGHRMQQLGANVSMLSVFRVGWLNPTLYGNRMRSRQTSNANDSAGATARDSNATDNAARDSAARGRLGNAGATSGSAADADTTVVVHPLATDRDSWYRYTGGDTLVTLRVGARTIPIVRVQVDVREGLTEPATLFRGDMDLDASRGTLVRLRGAFVRVGPPRRSTGNVIARLRGSVMEAVAYIDYENAERNEAFWLPTEQRIELQASAPTFGDGRAVVRVVSRFRDMNVNDTVLDAAQVALVDSSPPERLRRRLSFAPPDSLSAFRKWNWSLGDLSQGMHADDFDAVGPDRWRPTGAPRFDWGVPYTSDFFRFNRVEGAYVGFGGRLALRDVSPGTVMRATVGFATEEQRVRGRVEVLRERGPWQLQLRAGRSLDITNDFRSPLDSGSVVAALASTDGYDYVDRTFAGVQLVRTVGAREWQWRVETGVATDGVTAARIDRSPIGRYPLRLNRGVDAGTYWRNALTLAWRPDGSAEFLRPGLSGRLYAEQGVGELDYTRLEARLTARRLWGPITAIARADAGALLGSSLPTQQLFELGRNQGLPGYEYKDFAGTRAGVARGLLLWTGPWLRQPIRAGRALFLPGLAPGMSVGLQSGFASAPGASAQASLLRLGVAADSLGVVRPVSQVSNGWKSSVSAGFTLFSGTLFLGGAQPLERGGRWRWLVTFGQLL